MPSPPRKAGDAPPSRTRLPDPSPRDGARPRTVTIARVLRRTRAHLAMQALAVLLAACGGGGDAGAEAGSGQPDRRPLAAPGTWVVLGSSTAAGVGAPPGQGWVDLLADHLAALGVAVERLARSGLRTSQVLPAGDAVPPGRPQPVSGLNIDAALARQPVALVLSFPSNDAADRVPAADTVAAWQRLAALARDAGSATIVLGTQPRTAFDAGQRAIQAETDRLASIAFGACFVPLYGDLEGPDGGIAPAYRSSDGDHLNAAGHAQIEARLAAAVDDGRCVRLVP